MKSIFTTLVLLVSSLVAVAQCNPLAGRVSLMHEKRAEPYPNDKATVSHRYVSLQWPFAEDGAAVNAGLDGIEEESTKKLSPDNINYRVRLSQDASFAKNVIKANTSWAFYNPTETLQNGTWYWQYAYVKDGKDEWSAVYSFTLDRQDGFFNPPSFSTFVSKLPTYHPRILVDKNHWDEFIVGNKTAAEKKWFTKKADEILKERILDLDRDITLDKLKDLKLEMQRNAYITRESRRIVDKEEANTDVLIKAYLLTQNKAYFDAAIARVFAMISWQSSPHLKGDFNAATILSVASLAYDSFYDQLSKKQRKELLKQIEINGENIFQHFANHLENHIADNHNWQMNLRIFSFAAYAVYGDLPRAKVWADYAYNVWRARFPGLNEDGGWHNGDSYFHVNLRTLIEVPYFYSSITGYDFFQDPWYAGSADYVFYTQPPFSKSTGNGSSHQKKMKPMGVRVGYADALAKLTNNGFLADYVKVIEQKDDRILRQGFMAKPGDLSWFRLQSRQALPTVKPLSRLPFAHVFPQTGIATIMSNLTDFGANSMLSFRSSPYGSTSHALANQNAYNTFYGGESLFYSSGHHVSFTDKHSIYSHRASRAHNTISVDGMMQRIGVEGYGWIPRYYTGDRIAYLVGDASNAYGKVISELWQARGKVSDLEYSPANGWDENKLKCFRRHVVALEKGALLFIYDELEATEPVTWDYLLHTVTNPIEVEQAGSFLKVKATNSKGLSEAYLLSDSPLKYETTDQFFQPAVSWLRADAKGNMEKYENHWHFTAKTPKKISNKFVTIIDTRGKDAKAIELKLSADKKSIVVGDWTLEYNLQGADKPYFKATNAKTNDSVVYDGATKILDNGKEVTLTDKVPDLEI